MTRPLPPVERIRDRPTIAPRTPFLTHRELRTVFWGVVVLAPLIAWVLGTIGSAAHNSPTSPEPARPNAVLIAPVSPTDPAPSPAPALRPTRPSAARTAPRTAPRVVAPQTTLAEAPPATGTPVPTGAPPSVSATAAPTSSAPPSTIPGSGRGGIG